MSKVILRWRASTFFGYRIQQQDEKELQAVCYQDLIWVFEDNMIVGYSPTRRVELQCLQHNLLDGENAER